MVSQVLLQGITVDDLMECLGERVRSIVQQEIKAVNDSSEEQLLKPAEAVKLFHPKITTKTLDNWASEGLIKKHTIGRSVFYKKSEILSATTSLKKYNRNI